jgi:hypothetical protein
MGRWEVTPAQKSVRLAKLKCLRAARIEQGMYLWDWRLANIDRAIDRLSPLSASERDREQHEAEVQETRKSDYPV